MSKTLRAQMIATLIAANCDKHLSGVIDRETWHDEQYRLWALAAKHVVAADVMRLVTPSLGGR